MTSNKGPEGAGAQLPLNFGHRAAMGRDDFLVTVSNARAVNLIDEWPDWPKPVAVLVGPTGSGKSHLGEVWRSVCHAKTIDARDLTLENLPQVMSTGALLVENAPAVNLDQTVFFHFLNYVRECHGHALITSSAMPSHWPITLADLASRLRALPVAVLEEPDDVLLRAVLVKLFADRQISVDEAVIGYLVLRMERSLEVAGNLVDLIDRSALARKATITRPFVAKLLAEAQI